MAANRVPSRPRSDPGGGCHRRLTAEVQSSSGVTRGLTGVEDSGLPRCLRFSGLPRGWGGGRGLGASTTRRVSSCERKASVRKPSWLRLVREERGPVRRLRPGSLCSFRPLGSPTRPARLRNHLLLEALADRAVRRALPWCPPHTPSTVFLSSPHRLLHAVVSFPPVTASVSQARVRPSP